MSAAIWMCGNPVLRVGLTGGLGSGKSTVLRLFADRGAAVLQSDAIGRELMEPGEAVYKAIVAEFGAGVLLPGGELNRAALARMAFEEGRIEELNDIVHPAVIIRQEQLLEAMTAPVRIIESALIFETKYGGAGGWRSRFDRLVLVTVPDAVKIARFLERSRATTDTAQAIEAEGRRRLAAQMPDEAKLPWCDYVIRNDGDVDSLARQVDEVWQHLSREAAAAG